MKTIYLVRHAKSSWKDLSLRDRDRPLNNRGKRDAPNMADYLRRKIASPEVFFSSPSRRTQDTAVCFLEAFGMLITGFTIVEDLFHGDESDIEGVIQSIDDKYDSAMLFIHNPGITEYVNELTDANILNIPTCGIAGIHLHTDDWKEIGKCETEMLFYYYPKGLDLPTL